MTCHGLDAFTYFPLQKLLFSVKQVIEQSLIQHEVWTFKINVQVCVFVCVSVEICAGL